MQFHKIKEANELEIKNKLYYNVHVYVCIYNIFYPVLLI